MPPPSTGATCGDRPPRPQPDETPCGTCTAALAFAPRLLAFARRLTRNEADAWDLVQETWLRVHRAAVPPPAVTWSWVAAVCARAHIDERRADTRRRRRESCAAVAPPWADSVPHPADVHADTCDTAARRTALRRAVGALPPRARAVVVHRLYAERSTDDTARALGCAPGTVRATLAYATQRVRSALAGESGPLPAGPSEPLVGHASPPVRNR